MAEAGLRTHRGDDAIAAFVAEWGLDSPPPLAREPQAPSSPRGASPTAPDRRGSGDGGSELFESLGPGLRLAGPDGHALFESLRLKNLRGVRRALQRGASPNTFDGARQTLLIFCCLQGYLEAAKLLIKYGADVNMVNKAELSPLHIAADRGNKKLVDLLLRNAADASARCPLGYTPLMNAIYQGHTELAIHMVSRGVPVDEQTNAGETPLIIACKRGLELVAMGLINHQADLNVIPDTGLGAFCVAINNGLGDVINEFGAHMDRLNKRSMEDALSFLARKGCVRPQLIRDLVAAGADINCEYPAHHSTPLGEAILSGRTEVVAVLLELGADLHTPDRNGSTPLGYAAEINNAFIAQSLLEHGARLDRGDAEGKTPLLIAIEHKHYSMTKMFVKECLREPGLRDVLVQPDKMGATPLIAAANSQVQGILRLLLEAGVPTEEPRGPGGLTALHVAALRGSVNGVKLLLEHGADRAAETVEEKTPFFAALTAKKGSSEVVRLFLEAGEDPNAALGPNSALMCATTANRPRTVRLLIERGAEVGFGGEDQAPPAFTAAVLGFHQVLCVLLRAGANPNLAYQGVGMLEAALCAGHRKVVEVLLDHGADPVRTERDESLLAVALNENVPGELVELIREAEAKATAGDHLR